MRKDIIPPFEKKYGVKIEYVAGNSTDTLAKLQAQKGNQQIDVAIVDDGPMYQAVALGFCRDLAKAPIYDDIYDVMKFSSNKAVGLGMVGTGIMYAKKVFEDNKWPAPTSWEDLKDPKFAKKLVIPPLNNSYGLHALVMMAKLRGGGEKNIDPGFKAFKDEVGPNVLVYEPSPGKMTELFQSGQAADRGVGLGARQGAGRHRLSGGLRLSEGRRHRARHRGLPDRRRKKSARGGHVRAVPAQPRDPGRARQGRRRRSGQQDGRPQDPTSASVCPTGTTSRSSSQSTGMSSIRCARIGTSAGRARSSADPRAGLRSRCLFWCSRA